MRRAGLVNRRKDGVWEIGDDYLKRATDYEARQGGRVKIAVRSWMTLDAQIRAEAVTWLDGDQSEADQVSARITKARAARLAFLQSQGLVREEESQLSDHVKQRLNAGELKRAASAEAERTGRDHVSLAVGDGFEGRFEGTVDLASGRMALVGNEKAFAMVPWRPDLERQRGRALFIEARERGISWTLPGGRQRGLGR